VNRKREEGREKDVGMGGEVKKGDFQKFEICKYAFAVPISTTVPNFVQVGQAVPEIWQCIEFFKMAAVRHLGFVIRLVGPPTKCILMVSVTVQNLV